MFEGTQQLAAEIATIWDDIDDHISENPIKDIWSSIKDFYVIIIKTENLRTQYKSKHQEMRISLGSQWKETYEASYEEKLAFTKEYIKKAKDARKNVHHRESPQKRITEAKAMKVVMFLLKMCCGHDGQFKNRIWKVIWKY